MKRKRFLTVFPAILIATAIWGSAALVSAEPTGDGPIGASPGKSDRCPVCGMFPYKFPKWMAGFAFQDGSRYFHCSPKCMLHNLHNVAKYQPGYGREHIKHIWVTEYYTTRQMDAAAALFVTGSTLIGPMGLDLIPVRGREAAEQFKKDYGGESILTLDEISPDDIGKARSGRLKPKGSM